MCNAPDHLTLIRITGYDGRSAGFGGVEGILPEEKAEAVISFHPSVASDTAAVDDGFYLDAEVNFWRLLAART